MAELKTQVKRNGYRITKQKGPFNKTLERAQYTVPPGAGRKDVLIKRVPE